MSATSKSSRAADGDEARSEAVRKSSMVLVRGGGLPGNRLNDGQLILRAVGELAQEQAELVLGLFPLGDLDGDGRGADGVALVITQGFGQQIVGSPAPEQLEIGFDVLRLSGLDGAPLCRREGLGSLGRQDLGVGLADQECRIDAGRWIVDPGKAHVAVLGEHHDRRAAQRDLEALLGLG